MRVIGAVMHLNCALQRGSVGNDGITSASLALYRWIFFTATFAPQFRDVPFIFLTALWESGHEDGYRDHQAVQARRGARCPVRDRVAWVLSDGSQGLRPIAGHFEIYRGMDYHSDFLLKIMIDVAMDDALLDHAIEVIRSSARTGKRGNRQGRALIFRTKTGAETPLTQAVPDAASRTATMRRVRARHTRGCRA